MVNELGNNFSEVVEAAALLAADGGFEVVLPEVLVERLETNTNRRQQCPMPTGAWADAAGKLPKCWLPGDGSSCVLTCNSLLDPLPFHVACDLAVCSNLTLAATRRHFICADTGKGSALLSSTVAFGARRGRWRLVGRWGVQILAVLRR